MPDAERHTFKRLLPPGPYAARCIQQVALEIPDITVTIEPVAEALPESKGQQMACIETASPEAAFDLAAAFHAKYAKRFDESR